MPSHLRVLLADQRDNQTEQRSTFDQRRENQRARLNLGCDLGLTCHALRHVAADTADAETGANDCDTSAHCATENPQTITVRCVNCRLQQGKHIYRHVFLNPNRG